MDIHAYSGTIQLVNLGNSLYFINRIMNKEHVCTNSIVLVCHDMCKSESFALRQRYSEIITLSEINHTYNHTCISWFFLCKKLKI